MYQNWGDSFVDEVESNVVVVAPSLEIDLTDDTRVLAQVTYQRDRHVPNPGTGLVLRDDEFVPPNTPISQYNAVAPDLDDNGNDVFFASTQLDHNITDDWLATLRLNYNRVDSRPFEDRYAFGIYAGGNTYIYSTVDNSVTDTFTGELRLDGKLSGNISSWSESTQSAAPRIDSSLKTAWASAASMRRTSQASRR